MEFTEKILVVEDEASVRTAIVELLQHVGYRVLEATDGAMALRLLQSELPDVAILDVNMPEMGGFAALEAIRKRGIDVPVLMLSGQGKVDDRLKGLGLGADDYLPKPFDPRELLARVAALLRRRSHSGKSASRLLKRGDLVIDLAAKRAERAGKRLPLTTTEFAILEVLAQDAGRPVSRERILDAVWGYTPESNTRTVETHIWRLRKKLGDSADKSGWLQNYQGLGYLLASDSDESVAAKPDQALNG